MINLLIKGHKYEHDIFELIRTFLPGEEVNIIPSNSLYDGKGYLIISKLVKKLNTVITTINLDSIEIFNNTINLKDIIIKGYTEIQIEKIGIKKSLYNSLETITNKGVPWGILTGIRPTKVAHNLLDQDIKGEDLFHILTDEYKFGPDKAKLLQEIADIQRDFIYPTDKEKFSVYISIPFCPSICSYCSFSSIPISKYKHIVETYVDILIYEIEEMGKLINKDKINTVYIGGGTPTSISPIYLNRIIEAVHMNFGNKMKEFTIEAGRPDTINKEMLLMLKKNGIHRISINPQTMVDKTLKLVGRTHDSTDTINTYNLAREIGFNNINMDLILGLPEEGKKELEYTLKEIIKLNPDNLTIHSLSLKRGSNYKSNNPVIEHINHYNMESNNPLIQEYINIMELHPYYLYRQKQIVGNLENIGYSKKSKECIYNISMMEEKETIIGLGMGAVSKFYNPLTNRIKRVPNFKSIDDYINRINELIKNKKEVLF